MRTSHQSANTDAEIIKGKEYKACLNNRNQPVIAVHNGFRSYLKSARKNNPLVPDEVFARLETLLEGQVSERDLTRTNLKTIATQLIGDMASKVSEPEETQ
jgi:hypothetical protein